ncbi:hypothetical protein SD80_022985 [Scytonema tolypothrichoides VB-61278]|nr:hypothetical protein SD80_022985 [Scytonema tolypothrichoides VB-61278]
MKIEIPQSISFSEYAKLPYYPEDLLEYFGYKLERRVIAHELGEIPPGTTALAERIKAYLPYVSLISEIGKREFLIAPVLIELALSAQVQIRSEYPVKVSDQLRGSLDYLLTRNQQFVVIEAKDDNLQKGFVQLAVELIAVAIAEDKQLLRGAVSIGTVWQFAVLDREHSVLTQDLNLYRVPNDLEDVMQILSGSLE